MAVSGLFIFLSAFVGDHPSYYALGPLFIVVGVGLNLKRRWAYRLYLALCGANFLLLLFAFLFALMYRPVAQQEYGTLDLRPETPETPKLDLRPEPEEPAAPASKPQAPVEKKPGDQFGFRAETPADFGFRPEEPAAPAEAAPSKPKPTVGQRLANIFIPPEWKHPSEFPRRLIGQTLVALLIFTPAIIYFYKRRHEFT